MLRRIALTVWILIGAAILCRPAIAEEATVAGEGSASVRLSPARLRLRIQLVTHGSTAEAAIQRLAKRREAAIAKLKELGADPESITASRSKVEVATIFRSSTPPTMVPVPMPSSYGPILVPTSPAAPSTFVPADSGPVPAVSPTESVPTSPTPLPPTSTSPAATPTEHTVHKPPQLTSASTTLKAEWNIEGKPVDEILLKTESLREAIAKADLLGEKHSEDMSPEEQELLEEQGADMMPQQASFGHSPNSLMPGVPEFSYLGSPSASQRKAVYAAAVANARQQAVELGEAAGVKLGPICSVNCQERRFYGPDDDSVDSSRDLEVEKASSDNLTLTIMAHVAYRISPKSAE